VHGSTKYRNCKFQSVTMPRIPCPFLPSPVPSPFLLSFPPLFSLPLPPLLLPHFFFPPIPFLLLPNLLPNPAKGSMGAPRGGVRAYFVARNQCCLGLKTVSSGFSTFSVLWAAGTHMAVVGTLALSAGTLMASAGTPYRLVPAYFYPWLCVYL